MKTGLITPVTNIDADVHACKEHLMAEFSEVAEAWNNYHADETNKKNMAHLLEELVDLATACMTLADRIEKEAQIPDLVNNTLLMVGAKNYARGYHNKPMI
jgi:hypothetical protein